jgi:formylglycine-generating enzyme required for sulfatase activity
MNPIEAVGRFLVVLTVFLVIALAGRTEADEPDISWVSVPGGYFEMGDGESYPEEGPPFHACVGRFELSRTEITNRQFAKFVDATGYVTRAERGWVLTKSAVRVSPCHRPLPCFARLGPVGSLS